MTVPDITLSGKCIRMDAAARTFAIHDLTNAEHPFNWTEPLDVVMLRNGQARWKPGYYLTVTYNPDTHVVRNVAYWREGNIEWAKAHPKGSGDGGRPRNEKIIVLQTCYKECAQTAREIIVIPDQTFDEKEADAIMDWVVARAKKDAKALCEEAGVQ